MDAKNDWWMLFNCCKMIKQNGLCTMHRMEMCQMEINYLFILLSLGDNYRFTNLPIHH